MSDLLPIRRALISVSDKTGIVEFAKQLQAGGVQLLSTGGTYKLLREQGCGIHHPACGILPSARF